MPVDITARIAAHPAYTDLRRRRMRFGLVLTAAMLVVYYGFILLVAFGKTWLAAPLGEGVMTRGMPVGLGVILFTVVITVLYVRRANSEYDRLCEQVRSAVEGDLLKGGRS